MVKMILSVYVYKLNKVKTGDVHQIVSS